MTALGLRYSAKPGKGAEWERELARQLADGRDPSSGAPVLNRVRPAVKLNGKPLVHNMLVSLGRARGEKNPQMKERQL